MFTFAPFCPDWLKICHDGRRMKTGGGEGVRLYMGAYNNRHPPPYLGSKNALYPHNFSHQKYSKKSPWSDWKKFRKKFVGKCFGGRKAPNLVERGLGAKIRKIDLRMQR